MASVSHTAQSFTIDGRRVFILGASIQYARVQPDEWEERIAAARQAGFNTIETACPWIIHEPRKGRFDFQGQSDVKRFVTLCAAAGLRVILRAGPFVGSGFDGGGLPGWLAEDPTVVTREGNEAFLERVSRFFRKLCGEVADLQATKDGPILLVQVEHGWMSANETQAGKYLGAIARIIRECGMTVPLINANNLWVDGHGTIDTWRGDEELLVNVRQLRTVQPDAPRLVSVFETPSLQVWGQPKGGLDAETMLRRLAEVLAAGGQPIVTPFHGGTNFGFLGGRLPGPDGGTVTTSGATGAPLGEAGARGATYHQVRRLVTFANQFSHVFADLDPDYQPAAIDPAETGAKKHGGHSVVSLRGTGGRVVFVFANPGSGPTTLLLDSGVRLPIDLGQQPVGWYVMDVDLHGQGRLDYANLSPVAIVDRTVVILQGHARTKAYLSVNGTPLQATVPSGSKPLVVDHKGVSVVLCNQEHFDETYVTEDAAYFGIAGFDTDGAPRAVKAGTRAYRVNASDGLTTITAAGGGEAAKRRSLRLSAWQGATTEPYVVGDSPRFASLDGPRTLAESGAAAGYGWYRVRFKVTATRKRKIHAPKASDRVHVYEDGKLLSILGTGPGAGTEPIEASLSKGTVAFTALVDNFGRFAEGNDLGRDIGLHGHFYDVKKKTGARAKAIRAIPVDPFSVRGFIWGASAAHRSDVNQVEWMFTHPRKSPIIIAVDDAAARGTFVLNDTPLTYFAGASGAGGAQLLLDPSECEAFKRGKNVLRFAPDLGQPDAVKEMAAAVTVYESAENLTAGGEWAFAKWEPPVATKFAAIPAGASSKRRGMPWWWKCQFDKVGVADAVWFDTAGLSKGQVFVNGENLGRYFTSTVTGRAVGPQQRLYIPAAWLHDDKPNEILVFDEHGFSPHKTKMVVGRAGDLDSA